MANAALVLFSGGQDSAVCLAWALQHYEYVETAGFSYGQRHAVELQVRQDFICALRRLWPRETARLGVDHVLDLGVLAAIGGSALTESMAIEMGENGLPTTFVPARNLMFFTAAAALAYRRGISDLIGGMCETDYSGYPDCRDKTLQTLAEALSMGLDRSVRIVTPLMHVDKAGTFAMAKALGGEGLLSLVIEHTHSCYRGDRTQRHAWGYGCGACPACDLRAAGWERYTAAP